MASVTPQALAVFVFVAAALTRAAVEEDPSCSSAAAPSANRGQALLQQHSAKPISALDVLLDPPSQSAEASGPSNMDKARESGDGSLANNMLGQVEDMVKSWTEGRVAAAKNEPQGIEAWIRESLLPESMQTIQQMQTEIDGALEGVTGCSAILRRMESAVAEQEKTMLAVETKHHECKALEDRRHEAEEAACGDLKDFAETLGSPTTLKEVKRNDTDVIEHVIRTNYEFFNEFFPKFLEKRKACNLATKEEQIMHHKCQGEKEEILNQFCALKKDSHNACGRYATCFAKMDKHLHTVQGLVKELEDFVKMQYGTLACYDANLAHLDDSETIAECNNVTLSDTKHLDINYVEYPEEESCTASIHTNWDYTGFSCPGEDDVVHSKLSKEGLEDEEKTEEDAAADAAPAGNATKSASTSNATESASTSNATEAAAPAAEIESEEAQEAEESDA